MDSPNKRKRTDEAQTRVPGEVGEGDGSGSGDNTESLVEHFAACLSTHSKEVQIATAGQFMRRMAERYPEALSHKVPSERCGKEDYRSNEELRKEMDEIKLIIGQRSKEKRKIAASTLKPIGAIEAFGLTQSSAHIEYVELIKPPGWVLEQIHRVETIVLSKASYGEAYARLLIDPMIMAALMHQQQRSAAHAKNLGIRPPEPLRLMLEEELTAEANIKDEDVIVHGRADYAIYYEDALYRKDETEDERIKSGAGVVAIEAKKRLFVERAMGHLIAYMAMVHRLRKNHDKENCTVWGFASDGVDYIFARIDELSRFRKTKPYKFDKGDAEQIFGTLCSMFDAAALSSPNTSPVKDEGAHKRVLSLFRSPERENKLDYGLSREIFGLDAALNTIRENQQTESPSQ